MWQNWEQHPGLLNLNLKFVPTGILFDQIICMYSILWNDAGREKWSLVSPNIEMSWMNVFSLFLSVSWTPLHPFPSYIIWYCRMLMCPGKFREAEGEQWEVFHTIEYFHSYSIWLTDIKRLLCDIHHIAQDCSKLNLSDKCLKLIICLPPFFSLKTLIKLCWQSHDEISGSGKCWAGFESTIIWAQGNRLRDICHFLWH